MKSLTAPSEAEALALPAPINQTIDTSIVAPAPVPAPITQTPDTPPAATDETLVVGAATGSYNDDGLGQHTLCKNMATEGFKDGRFSYLGNSPQAMQIMRGEIASCIANGIEPVLALPTAMTPQAAAAVAAQFPNVTQFVIGNEVNSPSFSDLTPYEYVHLLAQTTAAIHAIRPDAQTRGFALASGYNPIAYLTAAKQIADRDFGGLENIMDILDVHLYRSLAKDLQMLQAYIQLYSGPLCIGETGFIVGEAGSPGTDTLAEQASDELGLYTAVSQYPQVIAMDFFRYQANPDDPFDAANVSAGGLLRPSYYIMQAALTGR